MRSLAISATLLLALSACGGGDDEADKASTTDAAAEKCDPGEDGAETSRAINLNYDAKSIAMSIDTASIDGQLDGITTITCIVDELGGPSSLPERIGATRALDGAQSEDWDGFEANWSFSGADNRLLFTVDAD